MPKPTLAQLQALLTAIGGERSHKQAVIYACHLLSTSYISPLTGKAVTCGALWSMARGRTDCPPGIYRALKDVST